MSSKEALNEWLQAAMAAGPGADWASPGAECVICSLHSKPSAADLRRSGCLADPSPACFFLDSNPEDVVLLGGSSFPTEPLISLPADLFELQLPSPSPPPFFDAVCGHAPLVTINNNNNNTSNCNNNVFTSAEQQQQDLTASVFEFAAAFSPDASSAFTSASDAGPDAQHLQQPSMFDEQQPSTMHQQQQTSFSLQQHFRRPAADSSSSLMTIFEPAPTESRPSRFPDASSALSEQPPVDDWEDGEIRDDAPASAKPSEWSLQQSSDDDDFNKVDTSGLLKLNYVRRSLPTPPLQTIPLSVNVPPPPPAAVPPPAESVPPPLQDLLADYDDFEQDDQSKDDLSPVHQMLQHANQGAQQIAGLIGHPAVPKIVIEVTETDENEEVPSGPNDSVALKFIKEIASHVASQLGSPTGSLEAENGQACMKIVKADESPIKRPRYPSSEEKKQVADDERRADKNLANSSVVIRANKEEKAISDKHQPELLRRAPATIQEFDKTGQIDEMINIESAIEQEIAMELQTSGIKPATESTSGSLVTKAARKSYEEKSSLDVPDDVSHIRCSRPLAVKPPRRTTECRIVNGDVSKNIETAKEAVPPAKPRALKDFDMFSSKQSPKKMNAAHDSATAEATSNATELEMNKVSKLKESAPKKKAPSESMTNHKEKPSTNQRNESSKRGKTTNPSPISVQSQQASVKKLEAPGAKAKTPRSRSAKSRKSTEKVNGRSPNESTGGNPKNPCTRNCTVSLENCNFSESCSPESSPPKVKRSVKRKHAPEAFAAEEQSKRQQIQAPNNEMHTSSPYEASCGSSSSDNIDLHYPNVSKVYLPSEETSFTGFSPEVFSGMQGSLKKVNEAPGKAPKKAPERRLSQPKPNGSPRLTRSKTSNMQQENPISSSGRPVRSCRNRSRENLQPQIAEQNLLVEPEPQNSFENQTFNLDDQYVVEETVYPCENLEIEQQTENYECTDETKEELMEYTEDPSKSVIIFVDGTNLPEPSASPKYSPIENQRSPIEDFDKLDNMLDGAVSSNEEKSDTKPMAAKSDVSEEPNTSTVEAEFLASVAQDTQNENLEANLGSSTDSNCTVNLPVEVCLSTSCGIVAVDHTTAGKEENETEGAEEVLPDYVSSHISEKKDDNENLAYIVNNEKGGCIYRTLKNNVPVIFLFPDDHYESYKQANMKAVDENISNPDCKGQAVPLPSEFLVQSPEKHNSEQEADAPGGKKTSEDGARCEGTKESQDKVGANIGEVEGDLQTQSNVEMEETPLFSNQKTEHEVSATTSKDNNDISQSSKEPITIQKKFVKRMVVKKSVTSVVKVPVPNKKLERKRETRKWIQAFQAKKRAELTMKNKMRQEKLSAEQVEVPLQVENSVQSEKVQVEEIRGPEESQDQTKQENQEGTSGCVADEPAEAKPMQQKPAEATTEPNTPKTDPPQDAQKETARPAICVDEVERIGKYPQNQPLAPTQRLSSDEMDSSEDDSDDDQGNLIDSEDEGMTSKKKKKKDGQKSEMECILLKYIKTLHQKLAKAKMLKKQLKQESLALKKQFKDKELQLGRYKNAVDAIVEKAMSDAHLMTAITIGLPSVDGIIDGSKQRLSAKLQEHS